MSGKPMGDHEAKAANADLLLAVVAVFFAPSLLAWLLIQAADKTFGANLAGSVSGTLKSVFSEAHSPTAFGLTVMVLMLGAGGLLAFKVIQKMTSEEINEVTVAGTELKGVDALNEIERKEVESSGPGIKLGDFQVSRTRELTHFLVQGLTGAGKTVVINSILKQVIERDQEKLVIHDPKGDFIKWAYPRSGERIVYGPWDKRSAVWRIGKDVNNAGDAKEMAYAMVKEEKDGNNAHFTNGARKTLNGLIMLCIKRKGDQWMFSDLVELVRKPGKEIAHLAIDGMARPDGSSSLSGLLTFDGDGLSKETASVISTLVNNIDWMEQVAALEPPDIENTSTRTFSVKQFIHSDRNDMLIMKSDSRYPAAREALFGALVRFISQEVSGPGMAEVKPSDPGGLWMILDEYPQLGKRVGQAMREVQEMGRSKGVRVVVGYQDVSQMLDIYGREGGRVQNSMQQTQIFSTLSAETAKEVSDRLGQRQIALYHQNTSRSTMHKESAYQHQRPSVPPEDLMNLGKVPGGIEVIVAIRDGRGRFALPFPEIRKSSEPEAIDNPIFMEYIPTNKMTEANRPGHVVEDDDVFDGESGEEDAPDHSANPESMASSEAKEDASASRKDSEEAGKSSDWTF